MSFLDKIKAKLPFSFDKDSESVAPSDAPVDQLTGLAPESQEYNLPKNTQDVSGDQNVTSGVTSGVTSKAFKFGEIIKKIKGEKKDNAVQNESQETLESKNPLIESAIGAENQTEKTFLEAPEIDESLLEQIEPPKSLLLYVLKGIFVIFLVVGVGAYLFFASQLGTNLKFATDVLHVPAAMSDLTSSNDELKALKTDLNVYNLLEGKFYLDNFSFEGDKFIRNYQISSNKSVAETDRSVAKQEMIKIKEVLKTEFLGARDKLLADYHITLVDPEVLDPEMYPQIFQDLLSEKMGSEIISREGKTTPEDMRDYKTYVQAKKLIANTELKNMLQTADIDKLTDKELVEFIVKLNGLAENELSAMQKIKDSKINWSAIINEIKSQTRIVDQFFNEGIYDEAGGIQYTNYDFDASTKKITITGTTKRYDSANFTTISDLIDQLNASPLFQGVEMKSFAKTGSAKEGYTATLRLSLELQKDELSEEDSQLNVESIPEFLTTETTTPVTTTTVNPVVNPVVKPVEPPVIN